MLSLVAVVLLLSATMKLVLFSTPSLLYQVPTPPSNAILQVRASVVLGHRVGRLRGQEYHCR